MTTMVQLVRESFVKELAKSAGAVKGANPDFSDEAAMLAALIASVAELSSLVGQLFSESSCDPATQDEELSAEDEAILRAEMDK